MCKFVNNAQHNKIDDCMRILIKNLNIILPKNKQIVACCCGHGKYPMTIIVKNSILTWDLCSNIIIPRSRRYYLRDEKGYYFVPEISGRMIKSIERR